MSSLFSKALVYLGLVDEDQVEVDGDHDPVAVGAPEDPRKVRPLTPPEGRRIEPPPATSRTAAMPSQSSPQVTTARPTMQSSSMRAIRPEPQTNILVVEEFGDAKILADWVRDRIPVVMDLRRTDSDLTRRVIDFSSGLIYALDGRMRKVGDALVLITPEGSDLGLEEKRRLQALGAYELPLDE
ncbi:MAG: cell division protein SepF [Acidimicrobiia bacterium]|nr:cell division protein SepF [Acidimicrobiia bacterium]MDH4307363.1 cell division protein SepF [Acidimicrobiia bacterium]MDH5294697.1 cell division protein SepF [Acidimicrobiia bacterium]